MQTIELKNVKLPAGGLKTINVEVVPFDMRNDDHVEFAFAYSDMLYRLPSVFKNVSDAATAYVELFMAHDQDDAKKEDTDFYAVVHDLRACRMLFNHPDIAKALNDFFENA